MIIKLLCFHAILYALFILCLPYNVEMNGFSSSRIQNINMDHFNGQTVLEEDYDENYEPTEEGCYYGSICKLALS